MLNKSLNQLNILELLSILFFISVGYGLILKYSFFSIINLPWLVSTLTPTIIFYTTFKVFFQLLIGVIIGFYIAKKFNAGRNIYYPLIFCFLLLVSGIPSFSLRFIDSFYLLDNINLLINIHFILYCSYQSYLIEDNRILHFTYNKENRDLRSWMIGSPKFLIFVFSLLSIFSPIYFGSIEASKVLNHANFFYNRVILENDSNVWYLIDYIGDKVLIKKAGKDHHIYKIVEIKEIKNIIAD